MMNCRISEILHYSLRKKILAVTLYLCLCFTNYKVSTWILVRCSNSLWCYFPVFIGTLCTISIFIYVVKVYLTRMYLNCLKQSIEKLDLVEFSCLMAHYKETQYLTMQNRMSETNLCLICLEYPVNTTTQPCSHRATCGRCTWKYIATCTENYQIIRCILCRTEATEIRGDVGMLIGAMNLSEIRTILKKSQIMGPSDSGVREKSAKYARPRWSSPSQLTFEYSHEIF